MAKEAAQILSPGVARISQALRTWREDQKLARRATSVFLDVAEKTVERWEDPENPALPPADQFLALVVYYKAAKKLLVLLGNWERHEPKAGAGVADRQKKAAGE